MNGGRVKVKRAKTRKRGRNMEVMKVKKSRIKVKRAEICKKGAELRVKEQKYVEMGQS